MQASFFDVIHWGKGAVDYFGRKGPNRFPWGFDIFADEVACQAR